MLGTSNQSGTWNGHWPLNVGEILIIVGFNWVQSPITNYLRCFCSDCGCPLVEKHAWRITEPPERVLTAGQPQHHVVVGKFSESIRIQICIHNILLHAQKIDLLLDSKHLYTQHYVINCNNISYIYIHVLSWQNPCQVCPLKSSASHSTMLHPRPELEAASERRIGVPRRTGTFDSCLWWFSHGKP